MNSIKALNELGLMQPTFLNFEELIKKCYDDTSLSVLVQIVKKSVICLN